MIVGENLDSARLASFQVDCGDEVKHMVSTRGSFIVQVRTATSAGGGRGAKARLSTSPPLNSGLCGDDRWAAAALFRIFCRRRRARSSSCCRRKRGRAAARTAYR